MSNCDLGICYCYPPHALLTPEQREAIGQHFDRTFRTEAATTTRTGQAFGIYPKGGAQHGMGHLT